MNQNLQENRMFLTTPNGNRTLKKIVGNGQNAGNQHFVLFLQFCLRQIISFLA